jgi:flavodoxin-like protein
VGVVLVVESWFGNTRAVAEVIAAEMSAAGARVDLIDVDDAPSRLATDVDLLVIGAPTHSRGLSTSATRQKATALGGGAGRTGVREWLAGLDLRDGQRVAAFDTTTSEGRLSGSAAKRIERMLARRRSGVSTETRSFVVQGTKGPLRTDQTAAARAWGRRLVQA